MLQRVASAHEGVEVAGDPVRARVDVAKVERIVENLVANAVKYRRPGTRVLVTVRADGNDSAVIAVDDEGPGVAHGDETMIFELFSRSPRTADVPGAGVGLALVAQFTALHDGQAWVENRDGGGASFRVRLPRRTAV